MKQITTQLSNHLDQEVTTLATCWKIVRRDGVIFAFTDHDQDLVVDGVTYEAESSYSRTAVTSSSDMSVDNLDVVGMIDSEKLDEVELRNGLFNRADIYIFVVNWQAPAQGILKVRRGWFGEVQINANGTFGVEIRGLAQALNHNFLEVYSPECRADFCDTRCKLNIADFTRVGTVTDPGNGRDTFKASELPDAPSIGTSVGAHKTWAIKPTNAPRGTYYAFAEVRFWDQNDNLIEGGTATDTLVLSRFRKKKSEKKIASQARDGRMKTTWWVDGEVEVDDQTIEPFEQRWIISFDSPVDIKAVEIIASEKAEDTPSAWVLEYSDDEIDPDDFVSVGWDTAKECAFTYTAAGQSAIWGIGSVSDAPINVVAEADATDIPPPYATVSTYVGGTVKWLTGRNKGRAVEITKYTDATNEIEMFEPVFYPVQIGDTFEIAQGCDKSLTMCKLYDNVINRRAEDFVPGNDELMAYPDAKD